MANNLISHDSDLTLDVYFTETMHQGSELREIYRGSKTFAVSRDVLVKSSPVFSRMLRSDGFYAENKMRQVRIEVESIPSMKIWLQILHCQDPDYDVNLTEVWNLIAVCDEFNLVIDLLYKWFETWFSKQPIEQWLLRAAVSGETKNINEDPRCLLYPTWRLDHPKGFLNVSRHVVYNACFNVKEKTPVPRREDLHLPSRIIQQMNAARGRLKTIIFHALYRPLEALLQEHQDCCDTTGSDYQRALLETKAWPIERHAMKNSINTLLDRLERFSYAAPPTNCDTCPMKYQEIVEGVVEGARFYFDGMCIDCMNQSKAKTQNGDTDYWLHRHLRQDEIVRGCRVEKHGQPTWYFSFMGRREDMDKFRHQDRD